jgi:hypothetical protein
MIRLAMSYGLVAAFLAIFVIYPFHILIALAAIALMGKLLEPIARRRGWGAEGRLTRYLNRPRFDDEARVTAEPSTIKNSTIDRASRHTIVKPHQSRLLLKTRLPSDEHDR